MVRVAEYLGLRLPLVCVLPGSPASGLLGNQYMQLDRGLKIDRANGDGDAEGTGVLSDSGGLVYRSKCQVDFFAKADGDVSGGRCLISARGPSKIADVSSSLGTLCFSPLPADKGIK